MRNEIFKDLVVYEIYPTSFFDSNNDGVGDLKGIELKLPYIKELGCNAIWINPFFASPFKDGGYDVKDFFDVDPMFGTLNDFDGLIKASNELGIKIIIDLVAGHSSEEHPLFIKSGEETRNEYSDLFIWNDCVWNYDPNIRMIAGRHPRNANYVVNFFSVQPAFNYGFNKITDDRWQMSYKDPRTFQARDYMLQIMEFWLKRGVLGFRVDMADSLVKNDDDKTATIEVWNYLFNNIREKFPNAFFVSEWSYPEKAFQAGFDCDFVLDHWDNFYHRLTRSADYSRGNSLLNGGDQVDFFLQDLQWRYNDSVKYGGYLGNISGNHDTPRMANYLSFPRLKMFYMFMFFLPGIPFIYYGDEIGMRYTFPMPNKDGGYQRVGTRTPMQWDHSKNDGFSLSDNIYLPVNTASDITLEDNLKDKDSLYYFIKALIAFRSTTKELTTKEMEFSIEDRILKLKRGNYELILNCSKNEFDIPGETLISTGINKKLLPDEGAIIKR